MASFPRWRWGWLACSSPGPASYPSKWLDWRLLSSSPQEPLPTTMTFQRQSSMALQWYWPAPTALVGTSHQVPWACLCLICMSNMFLNLILLHWRQVSPCSRHSYCLQDLTFLKVNCTSKDKGKESTEYLSLFCVLCLQAFCPIQQTPYIFPSLSSAVHMPVEVLLVALHISCQIQLQMVFSFNFILFMVGQCFYAPSEAPDPASTSCMFPFYVWILNTRTPKTQFLMTHNIWAEDIPTLKLVLIHSTTTKLKDVI